MCLKKHSNENKHTNTTETIIVAFETKDRLFTYSAHALLVEQSLEEERRSAIVLELAQLEDGHAGMLDGQRDLGQQTAQHHGLARRAAVLWAGGGGDGQREK